MTQESTTIESKKNVNSQKLNRSGSPSSEVSTIPDEVMKRIEADLVLAHENFADDGEEPQPMFIVKLLAKAVTRH